MLAFGTPAGGPLPGTGRRAYVVGMGSSLSYERRSAELISQTSLLIAALDGHDLAKQVPSCPDWTVNQLLRHLGFAHRWVEELVRERAQQIDFSRNKAMDVSDYEEETAAALGPWLHLGAAALSSTLLETPLSEPIASPLPGTDGADVWSRRMVHETVIHRWDAVNALGVPFAVDLDVARDTVAEWLDLALPFAFSRWPQQTVDLVGPGRTVHLHATDVDGEWVVDLTGPQPVVREGHEKAAVALRGPVVELMLAVYRRRPVEGLEVFGDRELLDLFLDRVRF